MRGPEAEQRRGPVPVVVLVFVSAACMGGNYVALKEALRDSSPVALTAVRATCGAVALLAIAFARGDRLPRTRRELLGIFLVSLAMTTVSSLTLIAGVKRVPSGLAALMASTMPLVSLVLAVAFLHERPDRRARAGLAVGIVGAAVLAAPALTGSTSASGVGFLMVATATWALGVILQKAWMADGPPNGPSESPSRRLSPFMFVGVQLVFSALTVGALTFVLEDGFSGFHPRARTVLPVVYSGVVAMALPFSLMGVIVRRASAVQASVVAYLVPFFGLLASWLVRGETVHPVELVGGIVVVTGVALVNIRRAPARVGG